MDKFQDMLKDIVPETLKLLERRYLILQTVSHLSPVGRRSLSEVLGLGERVIRSELDSLRDVGLLTAGVGGVMLTPRGTEILSAMTPYLKQLLGITRLEQKLSELLGIPRVVVVPGDCDSNPLLVRELGRAAARQLEKEVRHGDIIAITGGTTMAQVASSVRNQSRDVIVVPGRGGLGERVELQANTIAAQLGQCLGGNYYLLHAPDHLPPQARAELVREPGIAQVLSYIQRARILVHGIGSARDMASRRGVGADRISELEAQGAVAEAFGYYFDSQGNIVWQVNSIGLRLSDLPHIEFIMAVAGGRGKARAIAAVAGHHTQHLLVTDQGAAEEIQQLLNSHPSPLAKNNEEDSDDSKSSY